METREVVCIALINEKHEILIQKREPQSSKWWEKWSFFGGGIETWETPIEALKREAQEELWLELMEEECTYVGTTYRYSGKVGKYYVRHIYMIKTDKKASDFHDMEAQGAYFKTLDEVLTLELVTPVETEVYLIKANL